MNWTARRRLWAIRQVLESKYDVNTNVTARLKDYLIEVAWHGTRISICLCSGSIWSAKAYSLCPASFVYRTTIFPEN